jgi:hypothetical protein
MLIKSLKNPFETRPPEELTADLIYGLFVKEYTEHNALIGNYHTMVFGSRGSGKSMQFRYLEPKCVKLEYDGIDNFLKSESPFIGIYINCNKGDFTNRDFINLLADKEVDSNLIEKIMMHYFIMDIGECAIKTFSEQLNELVTPEKEKQVFEDVVSWFGINTTQKKDLKNLKAILHNQKLKIISSINEYQKNCGVADNHLKIDINRFADASLVEDSFLNVFLCALREKIVQNEIPYYLLLDEANELLEFHKKIINTFISQRRHGLACVKVSCQPLSYNVFVDLKGRPIQETHDYYLIDLDSLYTTDKYSYYKRIKEIAERRLRILRFTNPDVKKLLPENPADIRKLRQAEEMTSKEYETLPINSRPKNKAEYVRKYSKARFFQHLFMKTSYGYTGFENLVHFSSGIIRSFLQPCSAMVEEYIKRNPGKTYSTIDFLPYGIQRDKIEEYSNLFISKEIIDPMKLEPKNSKRRRVLEGLKNLLEALGSMFRKRLMDKSAREPRIISFSVKGSIQDELLQEILDYAVQRAFFHKKWYRAKSGLEMLECYILNRRLCPRYQIDLSSFQGRLELTQKDLLLAISRPAIFQKRFEKEIKEDDKDEIGQMQLFDF